MNLPIMDTGYDNWTPIQHSSTCIPIDHPEYIMPFGQKVDISHITDSSQFYCLNRGDKNPFLITNSGSNGTEDDSNTWTQWLNKTCDKPIYRRCLGSRPERCVIADSKYN